MIKKSVYEHYKALKNKEYSSLELTNEYLKEIGKKDEELGAYITVTSDIARIGSGNGAVILRDSINLPASFDSKMVFSDFKIHYRDILPNHESSPLRNIIDETEEIVLSHDQNIFSLNVSSINYDCPSRVLYSWKLEGFYEKWTLIKNELYWLIVK